MLWKHDLQKDRDKICKGDFCLTHTQEKIDKLKEREKKMSVPSKADVIKSGYRPVQRLATDTELNNGYNEVSSYAKT